MTEQIIKYARHIGWKRFFLGFYSCLILCSWSDLFSYDIDHEALADIVLLLLLLSCSGLFGVIT